MPTRTLWRVTAHSKTLPGAVFSQLYTDSSEADAQYYYLLEEHLHSAQEAVMLDRIDITNGNTVATAIRAHIVSRGLKTALSADQLYRRSQVLNYKYSQYGTTIQYKS